MKCRWCLAGKVAVGVVALWVGIPVSYLLYTFIANMWSAMLLGLALSGMP